MGVMIRVLFPIIGYLCVATVITIGVGYGYLRHTQVLDDQRMFRIVSMLHGVDLEEIAETYEKAQDEVPPEEPSYEQQQEQLQVASLHLQAKQDELEKEIDEFNNRFKALSSLMNNFNNFRDEVETFLNERKQEAVDSGIVAVGNQLKNLDPKKHGKPILIEMIEKDRTEEVIAILNYLPPRKSAEILNTFENEEELKLLYDLQKQIMEGDPEKSFIEGKLNDLKQGLEQNQN